MIAGPSAGWRVWLLPVGVGAFWLSLVGSLGYWVLADATARGSTSPRMLALSLVVTPIGLPYYLYRRRTLGPRQQPVTRRERWAATWAIAGLASFTLGALVSPPDPYTQLLYLAGLFPCCLLVAFLFLRFGR